MNRSPKKAEDIPGLVEILQQCQKKVSDLLGWPVVIKYTMKVGRISTNELITIICDVCEVPWSQVLKRDRRLCVVMARQLYCYFAYEVQKKPLVSIAKVIAQDHTTVIHSRDKIKNMITAKDDLFMPFITEVQERIDQLTIESHRANKITVNT